MNTISFDITDVYKYLKKTDLKIVDTINEVLKHVSGGTSMIRLPYPNVKFKFNESKKVSIYCECTEIVKGDTVELWFYKTTNTTKIKDWVFFSYNKSTADINFYDFTYGRFDKLGQRKEFNPMEPMVIDQMMLLYLFVLFIIYCITLLNTRNIVYRDEPNADYKRKLKMLNRGYKGDIYKILIIILGKKEYRFSDLFENCVGHERRFHSVRWHRRFYTKEKPLFGKYVGAVMVPAHNRGRKEVGTVVKNYKLT